jgi:D-aminopeptidase
MTDEVLVAIRALRGAGAERISVGDWHMVGTNIERERMPAGVEVRPIADLALAEADPSMTKANGGPLDAVVLLGHHASTTNPRGFSSHTFIWAPGPRRAGGFDRGGACRPAASLAGAKLPS